MSLARHIATWLPSLRSWRINMRDETLVALKRAQPVLDDLVKELRLEPDRDVVAERLLIEVWEAKVDVDRALGQ